MRVRGSGKPFGRTGFCEGRVCLWMLCLRMCGGGRKVVFILILSVLFITIGFLSCRSDGGGCCVLAVRFMVIKKMIKDGNLLFAYLTNCFVGCLFFSFILLNHLRTFDIIFKYIRFCTNNLILNILSITFNRLNK